MKQINSIVILKETGVRYIINNIAYKILDRGPESSNNPNERKTSVNFKPFNYSEKAIEKKIICHGIMMRLFLKGHNQSERFPL